MSDLKLEAVRNADARRLADLRVEAMRPSLEAAGRFDPARARRRFLDAFTAKDTRMIRCGRDLAGFIVVRRWPDHLYLDHLYLILPFQRRGIGGHVINALKHEAQARMVPIRLTALRGSPANDFYTSCGFQLLSFDSQDNLYQWNPMVGSPARQGAICGTPP